MITEHRARLHVHPGTTYTASIASEEQPITLRVVTELFENFGRVWTYELVGEPSDESLHEQEREIADGMGDRRRRDFTAGRICAHGALAHLGFEATPLLANEDGTPRWPDGVGGSISHTDDYAISAVFRLDGRSISIGIDAEPRRCVTPEVHRLIFSDAERNCIARSNPIERMELATLMFCAKEAFYKAQFPVTRSWVDFHDIEVFPDSGALTVVQSSGREQLRQFRWPLRVGFTVRDEVLVAVVAISERDLVTEGRPLAQVVR